MMTKSFITCTLYIHRTLYTSSISSHVSSHTHLLTRPHTCLYSHADLHDNNKDKEQ